MLLAAALGTVVARRWYAMRLSPSPHSAGAVDDPVCVFGRPRSGPTTVRICRLEMLAAELFVEEGSRHDLSGHHHGPS
jgi:hypothetical protein